MPVTTEIPIEGAGRYVDSPAEQLIGPDSDRQTPASQSRLQLLTPMEVLRYILMLAGATPNFQVQTGMVVLLATQLDRYQGKAQIRRGVWSNF